MGKGTLNTSRWLSLVRRGRRNLRPTLPLESCCGLARNEDAGGSARHCAWTGTGHWRSTVPHGLAYPLSRTGKEVQDCIMIECVA
jgi:hypothetical protein